MDSFFLGGGFSALFVVVFLLILGVFIFAAVSGVMRAARNSASPRLTVRARVVAKRMRVWNRHTEYFASFEVESGDRMELPLDGESYGMLAEGDLGELSFQGKRFLSFERR